MRRVSTFVWTHCRSSSVQTSACKGARSVGANHSIDRPAVVTRWQGQSVKPIR